MVSTLFCSYHTGKGRYLRILPVLHTPILWNKMAVLCHQTADVGGISFLLVLILYRKKTCRMPKGL